MTDGAGAISEAAPEAERPAATRVVVLFLLLAALTAAELWVSGMEAGRAARITALSGLLIAKVGFVISWVMRARASRPAARLAMAAIALAAGAAVVLMLDVVFRMTVR
jgi:uncharacterized membrane protein affecting hemolysin expression